jgi:hypothetical protein
MSHDQYTAQQKFNLLKKYLSPHGVKRDTITTEQYIQIAPDWEYIKRAPNNNISLMFMILTALIIYKEVHGDSHFSEEEFND